MSENSRPSFLANGVTNTSPVSTQDMTVLVETRRQRPETGAIWTRRSKTKEMEYMNIRMKFTKAKLQQLLSQVTEGDVVEASFVAFPNANKEESDRRPSFRIYESLDSLSTNKV